MPRAAGAFGGLIGADRRLIAHLLPTTDRSVSIRATRWLIATFSVGCAWSHYAAVPLSPFSSARVTSVGNRQRPHHGGSHAGRIRGTPTCHQAPPRRPAGPVHLPGPRPLRVLVPQVVAPLPRVGRRGPVRPDPCHPPRRPAPLARAGADHPLHPPPAPGPRLAGYSLRPSRPNSRPSTSARSLTRAPSS